jgi:protein TonB
MPRAIAVRGAGGAALPPRSGLIDAGTLRKVFPWATIPDGTIAAGYVGSHLPGGGDVVLTYDGPACPSTSETVTLPVSTAPPRKIVDAEPVWPSAVDPAALDAPVIVEVRARIGVDGVPSDLEALSGPPEFVAPALDAVRQWRYEPFTINGAPAYAPISATIRVTFNRKGGVRCPD